MKPIFVEPLVPTSISVTAAAANFPASMLLTRQPSEVCQASPGAGDLVIDVVFASAVAIDTAALLFHTESQGSMTLYGASSAGGLDAAPALGSASVHAGTVDPGFDTRLGLVYLPAAQSFTHWRLKLTGRANQAFEAGRLVLGKAFRPSKSLGYGLQPEPLDGGEKRYGKKGASFVAEGPVRPSFSMTFDAMTADDLNDAMLPLLNRCGQTRTIFMCADPDNLARRELWSVYGEFGRVRPAQRAALRWKLKLKIQGI